MQVVYERCCDLDIHKKSVTDCLSISSAKGKINKQTRSFGTTTKRVIATTGLVGNSTMYPCGDWIVQARTGSQSITYWKVRWNCW